MRYKDTHGLIGGHFVGLEPGSALFEIKRRIIVISEVVCQEGVVFGLHGSQNGTVQSWIFSLSSR